VIVYVSVGNSDDKLTQREWANFLGSMWQLVHTDVEIKIHGEWFSSPTSAFQNACWCLELPDDYSVRRIRAALQRLASTYRQDSIAWAEVPSTEFLGPVAP